MLHPHTDRAPRAERSCAEAKTEKAKPAKLPGDRVESWMRVWYFRWLWCWWVKWSKWSSVLVPWREERGVHWAPISSQVFHRHFLPQASLQNLLGDLLEGPPRRFLDPPSPDPQAGELQWPVCNVSSCVKWGWPSCREDTISVRGLAHRHPGLAYHRKPALVRSGRAGKQQCWHWGQVPCLQGPHSFQHIMFYFFANTIVCVIQNPLMVIQIKDSSGLLVFCSECSIIRKSISLVISENFLFYWKV